MRRQVGQPFQCGETLGCPAVFGGIDDLPLLIQILHTLLGERRPDDVAGQVLHRRFIVGRNAVAAEDVESGMPPCGEHGDHLPRDLSAVQEHLEHLVLEDGLQLFQLQERGASELRI